MFSPLVLEFMFMYVCACRISRLGKKPDARSRRFRTIRIARRLNLSPSRARVRARIRTGRDRALCAAIRLLQQRAGSVSTISYNDGFGGLGLVLRFILIFARELSDSLQRWTVFIGWNIVCCPPEVARSSGYDGSRWIAQYVIL